MKSYSYAANMAGGSADAPDDFMSTPYDLAIFDIMMPKMDGLAVVMKAREMGTMRPSSF